MYCHWILTTTLWINKYYQLSVLNEETELESVLSNFLKVTKSVPELEFELGGLTIEYGFLATVLYSLNFNIYTIQRSVCIYDL